MPGGASHSTTSSDFHSTDRHAPAPMSTLSSSVLHGPKLRPRTSTTSPPAVPGLYEMLSTTGDWYEYTASPTPVCPSTVTRTVCPPPTPGATMHRTASLLSTSGLLHSLPSISTATFRSTSCSACFASISCSRICAPSVSAGTISGTVAGVGTPRSPPAGDVTITCTSRDPSAARTSTTSSDRADARAAARAAALPPTRARSSSSAGAAHSIERPSSSCSGVSTSSISGAGCAGFFSYTFSTFCTSPAWPWCFSASRASSRCAASSTPSSPSGPATTGSRSSTGCPGAAGSGSFVRRSSAAAAAISSADGILDDRSFLLNECTSSNVDVLPRSRSGRALITPSGPTRFHCFRSSSSSPPDAGSSAITPRPSGIRLRFAAPPRSRNLSCAALRSSCTTWRALASCSAALTTAARRSACARSPASTCSPASADAAASAATRSCASAASRAASPAATPSLRVSSACACAPCSAAAAALVALSDSCVAFTYCAYASCALFLRASFSWSRVCSAKCVASSASRTMRSDSSSVSARATVAFASASALAANVS
mmetsp:Transcript_2551/g.7546  ORF Transcript_2551/g.7546 Transcript_2551/m.7546 type:complete len:546 (-) Transcript_2551:7577-9214(-)